MDCDITFAAQWLLDLSHSEDHNCTPVPLDSSHISVKATRDSRRYSNGIVSNDNNNQNAVIIENFRVPITFGFVEENVDGTTVTVNSNESSSLYMAAKILTDLKRTRQEPVPNVPSNHDKEVDEIDECITVEH
jgi:hypothetical protein